MISVPGHRRRAWSATPHRASSATWSVLAEEHRTAPEMARVAHALRYLTGSAWQFARGEWVVGVGRSRILRRVWRSSFAWLVVLSYPVGCFDPESDATDDDDDDAQSGSDDALPMDATTFVTTGASAVETQTSAATSMNVVPPMDDTDTGDATDSSSSDSSSSSDTEGASTDPDPDASSGDERTTALLVRDDGPFLVAGATELVVSAEDGVLANDEGEGLAVVGGDSASLHGGTVSVEHDGAFVYHPPSALPFGTDRFSVDVGDQYGEVATAEVRVVVQAVDGRIDVTRLGAKGVRILGREQESRFGAAVGGAGDVDGDGFADVLIGVPYAPRQGAGSGEAYLIYGDGERISMGTSTRIDGGAAGDLLGMAVSGVGDVDGDGLSDFAIGVPNDSAFFEGGGAALLFFGADNLPTVIAASAASVRFQGQDFDSAGQEVGSAGDVDGDGFSDLVIGSVRASNTAGEVAVLPGGGGIGTRPRESLIDAEVRVVGLFDLGRVGTSLDEIGDIDGDGLDDLLIGSHATPRGPDTGETYVFFGRPDFFEAYSPSVSVSEALRIPGLDRDALAGASVTGAGDVNGDGWADILIGAPNVSPGNRDQAGVAYLIFGGVDLPTASTFDLATADVRFEGPTALERVGRAVAGVGDFNGDGFDDLAIGSMPGGTEILASVYLVLGGAELGGSPVFNLDDAPLRLVTNVVRDQFGSSLEAAGDVNGDGFADIIIGAPSTTDETVVAGAAYIVFGDDLGGAVTALGDARDNVLQARRGRLGDAIFGGRGDDELRGDGGPDVLRGGPGNDVLILGDLAFFRLDGGAGEDTLVLPEGSVDLAALGPAIASIEVLHLAPSGACEVSVSPTAVRRLSDTTNTIAMVGTADDHVILTGAWTGPTTASDGFLYTVTATPTVRVRVTSEVNVTIE